jgi:endonuclease G
MLIPVDILDNEIIKVSQEKMSPPVGQTIDGKESFDVESAIDTSNKGVILSPEVNREKRREMLEKVSIEPTDFALERTIGTNDAVYSNFIELIYQAKRKVGRIELRKGVSILGHATGFMVSDRLLLTNWHVFETKEFAKDSRIQFFYEYDTFGNPRKDTVSFLFNPEEFYFSNKDLDYCLVAVAQQDESNTTPLRSIGYLYLDPTLGKLGDTDKEALNIIHHPDGNFMQLSIRENVFKDITDTDIWYTSDTAKGSSGSPVLNDQFQVVALHRSGVPSKNAAGDYLDKDGNPVPVINRRIDEKRVHWIANKGTRISVLLKDLLPRFAGNPFIESLKNPPSRISGNLPTVNPEKIETPIPNNNTPAQTIAMEQQQYNSEVKVSFPSSLIEKTGVFTVVFDQKQTPPAPVEKKYTEEELLELEIKRKEEEVDYSICRGYSSRFLGIDIPMPVPNQSHLRFAARIINSDSYILKYHKFSVIQHNVRLMPFISAINIEGNPSKRKDDTKRGTDTWLRDTRIPFDVQLDDKYYSGSGFDRGHMSRREDANWGNTADDARRNADLTCIYTNACPQIKTLNQSKHEGLWGLLEEIVLEEGAYQERGATSKISVFNGPIFKESDKHFRGVQIPMAFFKVILWLTDDKGLKATAFKLSQDELVDEIDFDKEQIDIDQNELFREYQISLKELQKQTHLDFSELFQYDTYSKANANEEELLNEASIIGHIRESSHNKS